MKILGHTWEITIIVNFLNGKKIKKQFKLFYIDLEEVGYNLAGKWTESCPGTLASGAQNWRNLLVHAGHCSKEAASGNGTIRNSPTGEKENHRAYQFNLPSYVLNFAT